MNQNTYQNSTDKTTVAQRIMARAAALWGLEHPSDLDPLVKLLLDAVAFEIATLQQQMVRRQGKMLEQTASLLLPQTWLQPKPAHAIVSLQPLEPIAHLRIDHQFYLPIRELSISGEEVITDRFFTPLYPIHMVKGQVAWQIVGDVLYQYSDQVLNQKLPHRLNTYLPSDLIWIGIRLDNSVGEIEKMSLQIEFPSQLWDRLNLLEQVEWRDAGGNSWGAAKPADESASTEYKEASFRPPPEHERILTAIAAQYKYQIFQLQPQDASATLAKSKLPPPLTGAVKELDPELLEEDYFWISARFPTSFNPAALHTANFTLNCVPMVNRKLGKGQAKAQGADTLLPLVLPEGYSLFAIREVSDDKGQSFNRQGIGLPSSTGSYAIHQTPLERFDRTSAEANLAHMIRLVREEAHMFAAYGQEIMLKQMSKLKRDLSEIYQQIGGDHLQERSAKTYLSLQTWPDSKQVECDYWLVPDPWDIKRVQVGAQLMQYKEILIQPGSCFFKNTIFPGAPKIHSTNQIQGLQYALLTRERIVSKSDVKLFLQHQLGEWLRKVEVRNGVAVSENRKRGLVRTIDILLYPAPGNPLSQEEWNWLLTGLTTQLSQKSVFGSEYRLQIAPTANQNLQ